MTSRQDQQSSSSSLCASLQLSQQCLHQSLCDMLEDLDMKEFIMTTGGIPTETMEQVDANMCIATTINDASYFTIIDHLVSQIERGDTNKTMRMTMKTPTSDPSNNAKGNVKGITHTLRLSEMEQDLCDRWNTVHVHYNYTTMLYSLLDHDQGNVSPTIILLGGRNNDGNESSSSNNDNDTKMKSNSDDKDLKQWLPWQRGQALHFLATTVQVNRLLDKKCPTEQSLEHPRELLLPSPCSWEEQLLHVGTMEQLDSLLHDNNNNNKNKYNNGLWLSQRQIQVIQLVWIQLEQDYKKRMEAMRQRAEILQDAFHQSTTKIIFNHSQETTTTTSTEHSSKVIRKSFHDQTKAPTTLTAVLQEFQKPTSTCAWSHRSGNSSSRRYHHPSPVTNKHDDEDITTLSSSTLGSSTSTAILRRDHGGRLLDDDCDSVVVGGDGKGGMIMPKWQSSEEPSSSVSNKTGHNDSDIKPVSTNRHHQKHKKREVVTQKFI